MDIFCEFTGLRSDGRFPEEMRFIQPNIGKIPGSTGSSHVKMGQTEVIAQIFGPREFRSQSNLAEINVTLEFADFAKIPHISDVSRNKRGRETEIFIKRTFEAAIKRENYKNSEIAINLTVIQDDGSFESVAINATTLALIDAGIPMFDFVVSLTASLIQDKIFLDSGRLEYNSRYPLILIAIYPQTSEIISLNITSKISSNEIDKLIDSTIEGCLNLYQKLKSVVYIISDSNIIQDITK